ncbi:solute carrier family 22 member 7 [Microcaecilia unicolor]|uniref:Solute carrier family 22 member 7 n=1 Tax=Microcaecilia unicolor TaxID=1415580 RepID=A0A6P7X7M7_9AMPH|nr:solute carrier family 22 member 7 [Microcaecilia unicolor]
MKFEDVLLEAGGFGRFQILILVLLSLPRIILPLHFLLHNFIAAVPSHHCAILDQDMPVNITKEDLLLLYIPKEPDGSFSSCKMFSKPQDHLLVNYSSQILLNSSSTQSCVQGWVYLHSRFTITAQWDLVCEKKGLNQASLTIFFIGVTAGAVAFGYLSDKFGRRLMLLVAFVFSLILGMVSAASVSYLMFSVSRSLLGVALCGLGIITVTLSVEWVDMRHRTLAGVLSSLFWSVGNILLSLVAYLIEDWRWLLVAVTSPCALGILSIWWLPESPRWLLVKGKVKTAHKYLLQCARTNQQPDFASRISIETLSKIADAENTHTSYSYVDLFRTSVLRKTSLCAAVMWFGVAFSYYGISLNITGFGLDMYMTHFVYGAIEIPAKLGIYFVMNSVGRRHTQAWTLLLTALSIGVNTVIPKSVGSVRSVIAVLGKGFSEAAFTTAILYTTEFYPTVLRQNGIGYCAFVGRVAASLAPLTILLDDVWVLLPEVVYCSVALVSGLMAFLLPETLNTRLPETINDVEQKLGCRTNLTHPEKQPCEDISEDIPLKALENSVTDQTVQV